MSRLTCFHIEWAIILRLVLISVAIAELTMAGSAQAQLPVGLYGIDQIGNLYSVSTSDATTTLIGNGSYDDNPGSLEWDPYDNRLLTTTTGFNTSLFSVDPLDGNATFIGNTNLAFLFEGGLQFAPNGTLFGMNSRDAFLPTLFEIDPSNGHATELVTLLGSHDINGMAWGDDTLLGLDRVTNSIITIDVTNGNVGTLAFVNDKLSGFGGMTNGVGNTGFFVAANGNLYTFDIISGSHSLIGNTGTPFISGLAFVIPEPNSFILLSIAIAVLFLRRRRNA